MSKRFNLVHAAPALLGCTFAALTLCAASTETLDVTPPASGQPYALEDAFAGLHFDQPVAITGVPGEKTRLFVAEKSGRIQVVSGLDGSSPAKQVLLDLTKPRDGTLNAQGECGLLGLAFPADHAKTGRFFVYYSLRIDGQLHQRLSRFSVNPGDPNLADAASEQPLWTQLDPAENHNGGDLHFGPDGYLYVSVGDGGAGGDHFDNARYITKGFHAGILRLDVDQRKGSLAPNPHPGIARDASGQAIYAVPADNPFVGATSHHGQAIDPKTVRTEFWATGLRNPWRFSFDSATGRLFAGDVGQNSYEEVDLITKGGDYGWSYREGTHPFATGPGKDQEPAGFQPIDPILDYSRKVGVSVTGGVVYRGRDIPALQGRYLCADFGTGLLMSLREEGGSWKAEALTREAGIVGFGVDPRDGSVLVANLGQGKIKRLKRAK